MKLFWREFRLIPVVVFAAASLFALKVTGLVSNGGYVLVGTRAAHAQTGSPKSWAQDMFNYPGSAASNSDSTTGSVGNSKPAQPAPAAQQKGASDDKNAAPQAPNGTANAPPPAGGDKQVNPGSVSNSIETGPLYQPIIIDPSRPNPSAGERAVLEKLNERRQELESRTRDLELREGLLKAAEKRLESRLGELKEMEAKIGGATQKKEEAEVGRFKSLVTMYESMKAKDAAKIFDRLDLKILVEVATQMNPRRMSDILAQMTAEAAERLTVELANRASSGTQTAGDLPKIEGRPARN